MSRDGYGTVHLRGFDVDSIRIPSAPFNPHAITQSDPKHLVLEDDTLSRHRKPESSFNQKTGELIMHLFFHNPEKDDVKAFIRQRITAARPRGLLRVTIVIAAETAGSIDAYMFFSRNGYERETSGEPAGYIKYEKVVQREPKPMDETDIKAARIKERSAQERVAAKELEPTVVPDFLRVKYEQELKKLA